MRKINPLHAVHAGWIRFKNKAGLYVAFTVFSFVVSLVITTVASGVGVAFTFSTFLQATVVALLAGIGSGLLNVGYAHFALLDEQGAEVEFGDFLRGFKVNVKSLVVVMVATVLLSQFTSLLMPQELLSFQLDQEQSQDFEEFMMAFEELVEVMSANMTSFYLFVIAQLLLSVLFLFAPYNASLEGMDAVDALKRSLSTALPQFFQIFIALLIVVVLAIPLVVLTLGLGVLVVIPVVQLVAYDMYAQLTDTTEDSSAEES